MIIEIELTTQAVNPRRELPPELSGQAGGRVEFQGIVRAEEDGRAIAALEYEAYASMAEPMMRRIVETLAARHPCLFVRVIHRTGIVPAGEIAIHVVAVARHRAAALALVAEFMDRLKEDVPIWKTRAIPAAAEPPRPNGPDGPGARSGSRPAPEQSLRPPGAGEVLAAVRELCHPLAPERVPLADAAGRILRETVCAPEDHPPFDRSAVDGYAVRLDDPAGQFRVVDRIRAGDWKPRELQAGEAVQIATGAALPGGGLQVLMKEEVQVQEATVRVMRRETGTRIRRRGEDCRCGQVLVEAGRELQPGALALLAGAGHTQPLVTRQPRVRHAATGDEIVAPEFAPPPGRIRDSNSTLVRAFFRQRGLGVEQCRLPDDAPAALAALGRGLEGCDLLLVSGGASVGEHDFTRRVLEELGYTLRVNGTNTRPGKPLIVAERGGALAFGLPGNPLAHFVCLNLYVRAALEAFAGAPVAVPFQRGVLADSLPGDGNARETFWPARWHWQSGEAALTPLRWSSSGDLTSLATANALVRVAPGTAGLPPGTVVEFVSTLPFP
jgi:molybdopterin molybdotransferase